MWRTKYVFVLAVVFATVIVNCSVVPGCPQECLCIWKSGKITVECSERGLIAVPSEIGSDTQVLDVSGNDLQILHQDTFKRSSLLNLQKLYMRNCQLGQIDKNGFRGLPNLIEIDLSENLLTYIPSLAFEDIPYLRNISLAKNPIQKVEPFSFRSLKNLLRLDLSSCRIQSIRTNAFEGLGALEHLKLGHNQLQDLQIDTVENLKLKTLELEGNQWKCDCHLRAVKFWIEKLSLNNRNSLLCTGGPERIKDKSVQELDAADFACKPVIKTDVRYVEAVIGGNVTIECRVESDPVATVSWYYGNGHILSNNATAANQRLLIIESDDSIYDKRSKLVLNRLEQGDAGEYHCVAENRAGNDESNFTLYVLPAAGGIALSSGNINTITIALGVLIVLMLIVIVLLVKKIRISSYDSKGSEHKSQTQIPEKNSMDTSSQKSHDSEIKSESGKAFTVTSDLSYSRSLSDIGNPAFSNPDLISGTNVRDSTCITPLPITRPISDYCHNWQKSYALPRAASSSGFNYDIHDRMPIIVDTVSAGSGSDEVFAHSRMSNDYPPDYGLPILPENGVSQPCAKTLKVWQRGVPVYPPMCGPPPLPPFQNMVSPTPPPPPLLHSRNSPADRRYQRCGTDV